MLTNTLTYPHVIAYEQGLEQVNLGNYKEAIKLLYFKSFSPVRYIPAKDKLKLFSITAEMILDPSNLPIDANMSGEDLFLEALLLTAGFNRPPNPALATQYLKAASQKKYMHAAELLAFLCLNYENKNIDKNKSKKLARLSFNYSAIAAFSGHLGAQSILGYCYENGIGTQKNELSAMAWYEKSAAGGYAKAKVNLGKCYQFGLKGDGISIEKDIDKAIALYQEAADQGHVEAQYILGSYYLTDKNNAIDNKKSFEFFTKSAEQGFILTAVNLGNCYKHGMGTQRNNLSAVKWYMKGVENDDQNAQFNLALCYEKGEGVEKNESKAVELYKQAAEKGHAGAQYNLGWCYQNGKGFEKNLTEAIKWFTKAAAQGHERAQHYLNSHYKETYLEVDEETGKMYKLR